MSQSHVQEHIDVIAKHEQEFLDRRTKAERLGDSIASFAGSIPFVAIHLSVFVFWILFNTVHLDAIQPFDPPPFSLLGTAVALEGILLASFIIMRQTRMSKRSEERDHLMLQILLLSEKEITTVLGMDRKIAAQVGLQQIEKDKEISQLSKPTSIDDMAQAIQEGLPTE